MTNRGFTLAELMVASVIATTVAGGTMMAFVTAARLGRQQGGPSLVEASLYAQQTLERNRNQVYPNSPFFGQAAWASDPLPAGGGSESIVNRNGVAAKRCYRVRQEDCDGVRGSGDCYAVQVAVCWENLTGCPCP